MDSGSSALGCVYFIRCPLNGFIKIGYAGRPGPNARFNALQTGSPVRLERLALMYGTRQREAELHVKFHDLRACGEWFRPGEDLLAFIRENAKGWAEFEEAESVRWMAGADDRITGGGPSIKAVIPALVASGSPLKAKAKHPSRNRREVRDGRLRDALDAKVRSGEKEDGRSIRDLLEKYPPEESDVRRPSKSCWTIDPQS